MSKLTNYISLVKKARQFATEAHKGVYRKGTNKNGDRVEYISHPIEVAKILHKVKSSHMMAVLISVCLLHDCVEDCDGVTIDVIREVFGELIANMVSELTSDPVGVKKYGKTKYLTMKMLNISSWSLCIKLADRLHNVSDIENRLNKEGLKALSWIVRYTHQTKVIMDELEKGRELSGTHKKLISMIREAIKPGLEIIDKYGQ